MHLIIPSEKQLWFLCINLKLMWSFFVSQILNTISKVLWAPWFWELVLARDVLLLGPTCRLFRHTYISEFGSRPQTPRWLVPRQLVCADPIEASTCWKLLAAPPSASSFLTLPRQVWRLKGGLSGRRVRSGWILSWWAPPLCPSSVVYAAAFFLYFDENCHRIPPTKCRRRLTLTRDRRLLLERCQSTAPRWAAWPCWWFGLWFWHS
jgi:hypothetical protein